MVRRANREPFGRQLIKAPCFTRHYDTVLMWVCRRRKACETGLQKQLHVYIRKAHQSTIWGIDESINGTGLLKRNCKKMPMPFRHWHFISIHGKIDVYSCKAQKERKVRLYEVTQVFRMGNGILFCHDDDHRI